MKIKQTMSALLLTALAAGGDAVADSVEGTVTLKGTAPANKVIKLTDKICAAIHKGKKCETEEYVVNGDKLANVLVYLKDAKKGGTKPSQATMDQVGCRYVPHVLGVMTGQVITVANSDPLMHNINMTQAKNNKGRNLSQPTKGMKEPVKFDKAEVPPFKVKCNVHKWMGAYIGVFEHPYFAVTDASGNFKINGVPAGSYTVEVWHEKAGTANKKVAVKGATKQDFELNAK